MKNTTTYTTTAAAEAAANPALAAARDLQRRTNTGLYIVYEAAPTDLRRQHYQAQRRGCRIHTTFSLAEAAELVAAIRSSGGTVREVSTGLGRVVAM